MKIAYIEDDSDARQVHARKMRAESIDCDEFSSAEVLLESVQPGTYDLMLIDVRLPQMSGITLLKELRSKGIHTPCILITAFNSLEYAREALNASASYLLEKPFSYSALRKIIERVLNDPGSVQHRVDRGLQRLQLTDREEDVARLLLKGLSNAEIARVTELSEKTIKQYISQLFEKARVKSRAEFFSEIFPI